MGKARRRRQRAQGLRRCFVRLTNKNYEEAAHKAASFLLLLHKISQKSECRHPFHPSQPASQQSATKKRCDSKRKNRLCRPRRQANMRQAPEHIHMHVEYPHALNTHRMPAGRPRQFNTKAQYCHTCASCSLPKRGIDKIHNSREYYESGPRHGFQTQFAHFVY